MEPGFRQSSCCSSFDKSSLFQPSRKCGPELQPEQEQEQESEPEMEIQIETENLTGSVAGIAILTRDLRTLHATGQVITQTNCKTNCNTSFKTKHHIKF